jgi:UDP-N-acetyl-D-mannosaminuronic acid dehydrogenase
VNILSPGPGVGGHCIPVDPWFIHHSIPEHTPLIRTAREVNMDKTQHVARRIVQRASRFRSPNVALLGLTYKPDVDDLRQSPALEIALKLAETPDTRLLVVEPHVRSLPQSLAQHKTASLETLPRALANADVVAILVAHRAFLDIDPAVLAERAVIDTVGLLPRLQSATKRWQ